MNERKILTKRTRETKKGIMEVLEVLAGFVVFNLLCPMVLQTKCTRHKQKQIMLPVYCLHCDMISASVFPLALTEHNSDFMSFALM